MLYDTHYRHNEALSPEALGTLPAALHALNAGVDDCRRAGKPIDRDASILLLIRNLASVAERECAQHQRAASALRGRSRQPSSPDPRCSTSPATASSATVERRNVPSIGRHASRSLRSPRRSASRPMTSVSIATWGYRGRWHDRAAPRRSLDPGAAAQLPPRQRDHLQPLPGRRTRWPRSTRADRRAAGTAATFQRRLTATVGDVGAPRLAAAA